MEFYQPDWDTTFWAPGAFKLDHLQPFKPILFWNFSNLTFMPQSPFPLFPREMRKWDSPNLSGIQSFGHLGHSNWIICSPLSQICSEIFTTFDFYAPEPFSFIPQENEKMEFSQPKWETEFWVPGALKLDHLQPFKPNLFRNFYNF